MSDPFISEIRMVGFSFAPQGWASCNGQTVSISQNNALFALLGVTFGGDGVTNFQLPDFQGRSPVGMGNGVGLTPISQGAKSGTENVTLLQTQMPVHTHIATSAAITVNSTGQAGGFPPPRREPRSHTGHERRARAHRGGLAGLARCTRQQQPTPRWRRST